jgi:YD repeat-containing protein
LSSTINASNYAYVVSPTSNRLAWTAGPGGARSFAYDAAGNLTGDGRLGFLYDERDGRLAGVDRGGGQFIGYEYNALGERVRKHGPPAQVPSGTNFFVYDEAGRLLGEYAADGLAIRKRPPRTVLRG